MHDEDGDLVALGKHTRTLAGAAVDDRTGAAVSHAVSLGLEYCFAGARENPFMPWFATPSAYACQSARTARTTYRFEALDFRATERRFNAQNAEFPGGDSLYFDWGLRTATAAAADARGSAIVVTSS